MIVGTPNVENYLIQKIESYNLLTWHANKIIIAEHMCSTTCVGVKTFFEMYIWFLTNYLLLFILLQNMSSVYRNFDQHRAIHLVHVIKIETFLRFHYWSAKILSFWFWWLHSWRNFRATASTKTKWKASTRPTNLHRY